MVEWKREREGETEGEKGKRKGRGREKEKEMYRRLFLIFKMSIHQLINQKNVTHTI